jgi:hypothetical protein
MTSIKPNDDTARAASLDPVHPARPSGTAVTGPPAGAGGRAAAQRAPADPSAGRHGALAADRGTPAVLDHRVVALEASAAAKSAPLLVHMADGDRGLAPREAHVWARAGRMTVFLEDGTEMKFTVLGPEECADLRLGDRWPAGEPDSLAKRMAAAAARDVGDVLTFPAWLARTTRLSGQRNAALHGLVKRLREASPGTAVFYGQTFGVEHHRPEHEHPYDHRGIVGREGYPKEL